MKRLMQRHATREDEVDALLRGKVLVNLYDHVVRSGIRASVESYSIKQIEKFYMPEREGPVTRPASRSSSLRALDGVEGAVDPPKHRRLQPRRLSLDAGPPRLARGLAASRPRRSTRTGSCRDRSARTRHRRQRDGETGRDPGARRRASRATSPPTAPTVPRSSRVAGSSPASWTGTNARRSRSGGTTTGCSEVLDGGPRRGRFGAR